MQSRHIGCSYAHTVPHLPGKCARQSTLTVHHGRQIVTTSPVDLDIRSEEAVDTTKQSETTK